MLYPTSSGRRMNFGTDFHCCCNITLVTAEVKQNIRLAKLIDVFRRWRAYFVNVFPSLDGSNFHQNSYTAPRSTTQNIQNATVLT
jgi:hypothetical protein